MLLPYSYVLHRLTMVLPLSPLPVILCLVAFGDNDRTQPAPGLVWYWAFPLASAMCKGIRQCCSFQDGPMWTMPAISNSIHLTNSSNQGLIWDHSISDWYKCSSTSNFCLADRKASPACAPHQALPKANQSRRDKAQHTQESLLLSSSLDKKGMNRNGREQQGKASCQKPPMEVDVGALKNDTNTDPWAQIYWYISEDGTTVEHKHVTWGCVKSASTCLTVGRPFGDSGHSSIRCSESAWALWLDNLMALEQYHYIRKTKRKSTSFWSFLPPCTGQGPGTPRCLQQQGPIPPA